MLTRTEWSSRMREIEEAVQRPGVAGPDVILIRNDPERWEAGPDQSEIGGILYQRPHNQPFEEWLAWLRTKAKLAEESRIIVQMAQDYGPRSMRSTTSTKAKRSRSATFPHQGRERLPDPAQPRARPDRARARSWRIGGSARSGGEVRPQHRRRRSPQPRETNGKGEEEHS
jgi:hypothetical protein